MSGRLIFLSRQPPWPETGGAPIRTRRLLDGLASGWETTFLTFEHGPASGELSMGAEDLRALLPQVDVVTVPGRRVSRRVGQAASVARAGSWEAGRYRLAKLGSTLRALVAELEPEVVHFDDLGVANFGPTAAPLDSYSGHGVEHVTSRGLAASTGGSRRVFAELEWRKLRREERRAWREMDLCLAISDLEAAVMTSGGAKRVALCQNGTDPVERLPSPRREQGSPLRILFVGSGDYQPYARGLAWFVEEVLPLLRESVPAEFDCVGSPPKHPVESPGVTYVGRVPDLGPWYAAAHAVILPMFEGMGTRLKVVETMAWGRPLVSTAFGAQGLPVEPGCHFLAAETPREFAAALTWLAGAMERGDTTLESMLALARQQSETLFWPQITSGLVQTYRRTLESLAEAEHT